MVMSTLPPITGGTTAAASSSISVVQNFFDVDGDGGDDERQHVHLREQAHERDYEELKRRQHNHHHHHSHHHNQQQQQQQQNGDDYHGDGDGDGSHDHTASTATGNGGVRTTTNTATEHLPSSMTSVCSVDEIRRQVLQDMIGHDTTFVSPFEWKEEHASGTGGGTGGTGGTGTNTNRNSSSSSNNKNRDNLKLHVPMVYCDFTASHRPVSSIEEYLTGQCLPLYGNTHTNTSVAGSQSSAFVSEARQIVAEVCNAKTTGKASSDVVLFAGSGTTAAVQLLIDCLGLKHYTRNDGDYGGGGGDHNNDNDDDDGDDDDDDDRHKPLVILGPMEHHSNLLPWREIGSDKVKIEVVRYDPTTGTLDMNHLERILIRHQSRPSLKIGTFCAASNLTGTVVDDVAVTALLHRYGALSFWDYATGASYLDMNMNPTTSGTGGDNNNSSSSTIADASLLSKDAIFFSGHKLLGGVGTPGVLIIKKKIVSSTNPPERCGGGTVFYVTDDHHRFLSNKVERYEGGTPDVVGIWRLGLVFKLKQALKQKIRTALLATKEEQQRSSTKNDGRLVSTSGDDAISSQLPTTLMEFDIWRAHSIQQRLKDIPNIVLVDGKSTDAGTPKLPIFSFLIVCGSRFLHYNYVCAVLNDLFGIQSRGGCQCAGPYAQLLLGMEKTNDQVEQCLVRTKDELLRPGVTRLSLPTIGTTKEQEDYVIEAIRWVATNGWKLLHVYRCNHRSGEWRHKSRPGSPLGIHERLWLSHYQMFDTLRPSLATGGVTNIAEWSIEQAMQNADKMLELAINDQPNISQALKMVDEDDDSSSALRWYVYPKDVARSLRDGLDSVQTADDGSRLLGALNPLVLRADSDIKRLLNAPEDLPTIQPKKHLDRTAIVHFRDGEHTGDAPLEEVLEGFGSGELSEDCMVYDTRTDRWKPISSFVTESEPQGHTTPDRQESNDETPTAETFDAVPCDNALAQQVVDIDVDVDDELPLMEKNDKKRPARDSKSWGVGLVQVPGSSPSVNGGAIDIETTRSKSRHVKPPPKLMRQVTQAMIQWDMLQDGDRLLLGLSGGKDSLSLLHILLEFQKKLPIKFDIEVCTVDPMTPSFDPSPLIPYVESLGLKYHFIRDEIVERAATSGKDGLTVSSLCAYCARMKRGNLYACARKNNCNKLVLAQHLDDLAESFFMSVMHNGFLRTMKANYKINAGDLSVIRPLAYCRESLMTDFAKSANLPIINENCPACFEEPKERARVKKLLSKEETLYPQFYDNIKRALMPLMHDDATAILRSYTDEAIAKSRRDDKKVKTTKQQQQQHQEEHPASTMKDGQVVKINRQTLLAEASEDDLIAELARRRAERYRLAGAMPSTSTSNVDPTGQVCTLNGANGTIPCRELME